MAIKPKELAVTAALLAAVGGAGFWALKPTAPTQPFKLETKQITVNVAGEVNKPGMYQLPFGARAQIAIRAAGGYSAKAEQSLVNPAQILEDGEQLRVPSKNADGGSSSTGASSSGGNAIPGERINVNTATETELESLPGVGPKMAAKIIAGRPYSSMNDLDKVKGIGPSMLKKLEPRVKF